MSILHPLRFIVLLSPALLCFSKSSPFPHKFAYSLGPYNPFYKPDFFPGLEKLDIQILYNAKGTLRSVQYGNFISTTDAAYLPIITYFGDPNKLYTVIMLDPDAPSKEKPTFSPFLHLLVVNIPGSDVGKGDFEADYVAPNPPPGTGFHRYEFLLYCQTKKIDATPTVPASETEARTNFPLQDFLKKNELIGPVSFNFFKSKNSDESYTAVKASAELTTAQSADIYTSEGVTDTLTF